MKDRKTPKTPSRTPTIRDVAMRAGVSPATVSNTLSGLRGVTGERRRAVLEAVDALGYTSNHAASSLRRGKTRTVEIVVPNLGNEFYAGLVREWEKIASSSNFEMLVVASGEDPQTEARRIESLIARQIDGLLVVAAHDEFGSTPGFPRGSHQRFWSTAREAIRTSIRSARTTSTRLIAARDIFWSSVTRS